MYLKMASIASNADQNILNDSNSSTRMENDVSAPTKELEKKKEKFHAAIFLSAVTGISALAGFGTTVASVRKKDPKYFSEGMTGVEGAAGLKGVSETGASLALKALGWGTLYAVTGCGFLFYGIWKISGASNAAEFRHKMGSILPRIPKNDPPRSRTEFEGLTDLLRYISEDWNKTDRQDTK